MNEETRRFWLRRERLAERRAVDALSQLPMVHKTEEVWTRARRVVEQFHSHFAFPPEPDLRLDLWPEEFNLVIFLGIDEPPITAMVESTEGDWEWARDAIAGHLEIDAQWERVVNYDDEHPPDDEHADQWQALLFDALVRLEADVDAVGRLLSAHVRDTNGRCSLPLGTKPWQIIGDRKR